MLVAVEEVMVVVELGIVELLICSVVEIESVVVSGKDVVVEVIVVEVVVEDRPSVIVEAVVEVISTVGSGELVSDTDEVEIETVVEERDEDEIVCTEVVGGVIVVVTGGKGLDGIEELSVSGDAEVV